MLGRPAALAIIAVASALWLVSAAFPIPVRGIPPLQAFSWLAACALPAALVGLLAHVSGRRRPLLTFLSTGLALALITLVAPRIPSPFGPPGKDATVPDATVRILSLNTLWTTNNARAISQTISELNPDAVILAETTPEEVADVEAHSGYHRAGPVEPGEGAGGVQILSRAPVRGRDHEGITEFQMPEASVAGARIVGVHTLAPVAGDVGGWDRELRGLKQFLESPAGDGDPHKLAPLIMAGDFNATWWHPQFRALAGTRVDGRALHDCGGGLTGAPTWPSAAPTLRLDHILTTLTCEDAGTVKVDGTDHRGVWADLI